MPRVKVCGHTREEDVAGSIDAGVDAIGVIADVPVDTPREVAPRRARELLAAVPPFISCVLVTMPERPEAALELVDRVEPDALQIHGGLGVAELDRLSAQLDIDLVVGTDIEDAALDAIAEIADAILLDSRDEDGSGGTGRTHDWARSSAIVERLETPVVLAGGLTPGNVAEAVRQVKPFAVDVATGVESSGGRKDTEAVQRFVSAARRPEAVEA